MTSKPERLRSRMLPRTPRATALVMLVIMTVIWGTTFPLIKGAIADISPLLFSSIRFVLVSIFLLPLKVVRQGFGYVLHPAGAEQREFRKEVVILGVSLGAGYIFQVLGLLTTTPSKSAFLTSTAVIWVPVISFLTGRERLSLHLVASILLSIVGIYLLTSPASDGSGGIVIGDVLTMLCALSFAFYIVWMDRAHPLAVRLMGTENRGVLMLTGLQMVLSAIVILIALPVIERPHFTGSQSAVLALVFTALMATALTGYLQTRYQKEVSPTVASVVFMLEPVAAAGFSYLILGEIMGQKEIAGAGLIIIGVLLAQLSPTDT